MFTKEEILFRRFIMDNVWEIVLGIVLLVMSVILIVCVLMQSGKDKRLSGSIAGGAETFFGKTKGKSTDKIFSRVTTILSFVFVAIMVVMYILVAKAY